MEKKPIPGKEAKTNNLPMGKVSRRQFIKDVGAAIGSGAIASLALTAGCNTAETSLTTPAASAPASSSQTPATTSAPTVIPTTARPTTAQATAATTSATPTNSSTATTTPVKTSTPPASTTSSTATQSQFIYIPPTDLPPSMVVPDTACTVATDRVFAEDHTWVKTVATNIVVLGLTPTMMEILDHPKDLSLPDVGETLAKGDAYGAVEGYKMSADLISPVSGKVIQVDKILASFSGQDVIAPLMNDPYGAGWFIVIQISKPEELKALLTPQQYFNLLKK